MLNHIRNVSKMQYREIVRTLDKMQISEIKEDDNEELLYLRLKVDGNQKKISNSIKIVIPNDVTSQKFINQVFV